VTELIRNYLAFDIQLRLILLCSLMFAGTSAAAQAIQKDVTPLEPGAPLERTLSGGETNAYRIHLNAGDFLHVVVDQEGIDVTVSLIGPDSQPVAVMNTPNGDYGPEPLVAIAPTSGDYRLEVLAPNKTAPTGHYKMTVVGLREATPADRDHVAAESAFSEAYVKLGPQRTAEARRKAIEKFEVALRFFQSAGDRYRQAWTLYIVGLLYAESGEFRTAMGYANQTVPLFHSFGDLQGESGALNLLGGMSDVLGEPSAALNYYSQALFLARKRKSQSTEASILNNIGKIYSGLDDWQKAIEYYQQALEIFRATGNQRLEATALHNIGMAYSGLGEMKKTLDYLQQSLPLRRAVGDKAGEADALTNIGSTYALMDRSREAIVFFNQALPLRLAVGDRRGEGITLDYLGVAYSSLGEPAKALIYHQQALERHQAANSRRYEAIALGNIGHVYTLMGEPEKAIEYHRQALTLFRVLGDRQNEAKMLQGLARAERQLGNLPEARKDIETALSLTEAVRANVSSQQLRASYFASQRDPYELYIDLLMKLHQLKPTEGHDAEALQASERGRARSLMEMLNEAHVDIRQGVGLDLIAKERELNQLLNAKAQREIQLKTQKGSAQEIATLDKEISGLEEQYQQVQAAIRKASPAYAALTQPQPLGLKKIQTQLDQGTLLLEYSLGEERSYVWAVTQNLLKTYELPKREQIEHAARRVYELLTARSQSKAGENPQQKLERIAQTDSQLLNATKELSQMVLGPIGSELGTERLVIVADGALQYVPFAALSVVSGQSSVAQSSRANNGLLTNYRPLIQDHEIISLPSASALAIQRQGLRNRNPAPNAVAVIADPVFSASDERLGARAKTGAAKQGEGYGSANTRIIEHLSDDSGLVIRRLKFTRQEADQILAEAPRAKNLRAIDFKANRATATGGELSKYRYVHFATHGYIDSERPDLSAIVLSLVDEEGKPQDGFLRANEIYNLNLPAELVVLSACETGLGKEIKGEGLVGLTQGFMYAGARRVVVSLWNVNDKATAELMARFYRGMLKENKTPAAALRAAQVEMSRQRQWQSPYYWAAFVLQGEWK
jgi:CHAT domain-containing protein/tetratricopeptide (TPR) repeat protein